MDDLDAIVALCCALSVLCALLSFAVIGIERRLRRLEVERQRRRAREWDDTEVTLSRWESIGGTQNLHRRHLGWWVRVVLWWVRVRERWL